MRRQGLNRLRRGVSTAALGVCLVFCSTFSRGAELNRDGLLSAIRSARRELVDRQLENGAFPADGFLTHSLGTTSLATLALIRTSTTRNDPSVRAALEYLRTQRWSEVTRTHEIALGVMALVCNGDSDDLQRIEELAHRLIEAQSEYGGWTHRIGLSEGDLSISYLAFLALRESSRAGVTVPESVFEKMRGYWLSHQNEDGGWFDFAFEQGNGATEKTRTDRSTFTATLAGITVLSTCGQILEMRSGGPASDGCQHPWSPDAATLNALDWFESDHGWPTRLPQTEGASVAFHLYGLEHSGRLRGPLHPREREWYLQGARTLLATRDRHSGLWEGSNAVVATSYALLFLSTEVAPALIHRLKWDGSGNRHPHDLWNLTEEITCRRDWQRCLTAREVTLSPELAATGQIAGVLAGHFRDVPVLFLSGEDAPHFSDEELEQLRTYLDRGGVLLAAPGSDREAFEQGFMTLLSHLNFPDSALLTALPADHPVYRSQFLLNPEDVVLYGVETGCRTAIFYCRENLSCGWESANPYRPSKQRLRPEADLATRIGANVIACAMGDMIPAWPEISAFQPTLPEGTTSSSADRSLLQVVRLRHGRSWNTAPRAFTRLMEGVNAIHGPTVVSTPKVLTLDSPELFDQMLLSLHGGHSFSLRDSEIDALRAHLMRGGFLFADACCGSEEFDASFRRMISLLFPGEQLKVLPPEHEFFTFDGLHQLDRVKMRLRQQSSSGEGFELVSREGLPLLEGLEIDGRLAVIYSRYDLSCALAEPGRIQCEGYVPGDAMKIGVQIVLYALVQDYHPPEGVR